MDSMAVRGARQRTILALLLLRPGQVVPADVFIDEVWNDSPPATARTQVAICIAGLRKMLRAAGADEELIVTAHPGYRLDIDPGNVDAGRFDQLVARAAADAAAGRTQQAGEAYDEALALWRGSALTGVTGLLVEEEAARLEELRLTAYDDGTEVSLSLGRHAEVLPDLAAMVREHPMRERLHHHLMLAHYRSGRRAEAMEAYRDARRLFSDELGLEPGPELQELHQAILRDDPDLQLPGDQREAKEWSPEPERRRLIPNELPPDVPGFTGREDELTRLDGLLEAAGEGGSPRVGLLTGVAGVGKTGLALRWAHRVAEHFPDGRLFADLRGYDVGNANATAHDVMSRFLRSLGVPSEEIPAEPEERVPLYRSVLAGRRVLMVLDNVRTLAQVMPLLPSNGCVVLITSREPMESVVTWPPSARIRLGLLAAPEAAQLLGRLVGEERIASARADAARLAELCDRLPLALRIAGARLASKPHWTVRHLVGRLSNERRRLDELSQGESQVRASLALSYRYLPGEAAELYRLLGLLPVPDFDAWTAAALLGPGLTEDCVMDAERLLEHLVDAQLVDVTGSDGGGRLRYRLQNLLRLFAHERAVAEDSAESREQALAKVFSSYLTLAVHAHQREYGGDFDVLHGSAPRCEVDAELLEELLPQPLEWFERERLSLRAVVEQAAGSGRDELAWELTMLMLTLFETRNYTDDWRICGTRALAAAEEAGNIRGQGAMLHVLGALELRLRRLQQAADCFTRARELFESAGEEHGRALVLRDLSVLDRMTGDLDRSVERLTEASEIFRTVGDLSSLAYALNSLAQTRLEQADPQEALDLSLEALRVAESYTFADSRSAALAIYRAGQAYLALERPAEAESSFRRVLRIVEVKGDLVGRAHGLLGLGEVLIVKGDEAGARSALTEVAETAERIDSPLVGGRARLVLAEAERDAGREADARQHLEAAAEIFERVGAPLLLEQARRALAEPDEDSMEGALA
ncbi:BTAD domain-containing putative transcriptional regulator [Streptomyces boninensis]|uniref:AfsR/SARP family transcriptional regulator n=1 Tax=Streptomyces boninensis TaxID=2039455 RepID=UPI003B22675D